MFRIPLGNFTRKEEPMNKWRKTAIALTVAAIAVNIIVIIAGTF